MFGVAHHLGGGFAECVINRPIGWNGGSRKHRFDADLIGYIGQGQEIHADFLLFGGKQSTISIAPVQPAGLQILCYRKQYGLAHHRKRRFPGYCFQPGYGKEQIAD